MEPKVGQVWKWIGGGKEREVVEFITPILGNPYEARVISPTLRKGELRIWDLYTLGVFLTYWRLDENSMMDRILKKYER